jgi:hypothetical protein
MEPMDGRENTMKTKTKKVKANLNTRTRWEYVGTTGNYKHVKVVTHRLSVPADAASYEQMVVQGAEGIALRQGHPWGGCGDGIKHIFRDDAKAVLAAIGITRPTK